MVVFLAVSVCRGPELMMHPELQIDVTFLGPLLSDSVKKELLDTYVLCVALPFILG